MKIHCIGIGGIGVSSLAQYYLAEGHQVSGSDLAASEITEFLQKKGVKVSIGNNANNVSPDFDLVIYSPAVPKNNPELLQAKKQAIKTLSYPEALGELTKRYKTIAVSGSHGKSTTTAMIALILERAGIDPTVIIGTKLKEFGNSNFRKGAGEYLVIEACEYDGSFLHYRPEIIVITNIDREHLDYFKTFTNVKKAFKAFVQKLPRDGVLVFNRNDKHMPQARLAVGYSLRQPEAKKLKTILKIPGNHNVANGLAALAVARQLGIKDSVSFKSLAAYRGSWRRFEEKKGKAGKKPIIVISDYAHHPSEIAATLQAARQKYPAKKIWLLFQPHQRRRTSMLFSNFVEAFRRAPVDHVIITDVYDVAGRETTESSPRERADYLVKKIAKKNTEYVPFTASAAYVSERIGRGEVLIIMGAGDVYRLADRF